MLALARLASLEHEVVAIGPIAGPADVIIVSRLLKTTKASMFVTDVLYRFDELIYYYLIISMAIVVLLLTIVSTDIYMSFQ